MLNKHGDNSNNIGTPGSGKAQQKFPFQRWMDGPHAWTFQQNLHKKNRNWFKRLHPTSLCPSGPGIIQIYPTAQCIQSGKGGIRKVTSSSLFKIPKLLPIILESPALPELLRAELQPVFLYFPHLFPFLCLWWTLKKETQIWAQLGAAEHFNTPGILRMELMNKGLK